MAVETENNTSKIGTTDEALKLSLYITLKNLYERWFSTYDRDRFVLKSPNEEKKDMIRKMNKAGNGDSNTYSEFSNFVYVDSFYNDIGEAMNLNPGDMVDVVNNHRDGSSNFSLYDSLYEICTKNRLMFITLPVYNNLYNVDTIVDAFRPKPSLTMSVMDGATYMCMYIHQASQTLPNNPNREDDGIDIVDAMGNLTDQCDKLFSIDTTGTRCNMKVPVFGVTYARQNQSYFKNITVNMDAPKVTDYSLQIQNKIAKMAPFGSSSSTTPLSPIAQDAYSIFANYSYTCNVEMLGCMNIMPMMYFQLNNIPMFRGAYMITSVKHNITPGNVTTKFTGVRVSRRQLPYNNDVFARQIDSDMGAFYENLDLSKSFYGVESKTKKLPDGEAKNSYLDSNKVKDIFTKWTMPKGAKHPLSAFDSKELTKGNKDSYTVNDKSERVGFYKYGILIWLMESFRKGTNVLKDPDDFRKFLLEHFDTIYNMFFNKTVDGLISLGYAFYNSFSNEEMKSLTFSKYDIAIVEIVNKRGDTQFYNYYAMYDGKKWVSDRSCEEGLYVYDGYRLSGGVSVWRFDDAHFEECLLKKKYDEYLEGIKEIF